MSDPGDFHPSGSAAERAAWERALAARSERRIDATPRPKAVGTRQIIIQLSVADIRTLVGAPDNALVQLTEERDLGPNGRTEASIHVSWREP